MHGRYTNINNAFYALVSDIHDGEILTEVEPSRNGEVMMIPEPVILTYENPTERVLFNTARDANPFFHLFEALWMLAGRNDVAALDTYNSNMKNYSDDGETFNGAYGYRWRKAKEAFFDTDLDYIDYNEIDQLNILINHLKNNPTSRRAVLQMWNVEDDLLQIDKEPDTRCTWCVGKGVDPGTESTYCKHCSGTGVARKGTPASKDVCCNLSVMFSVETGVCPECGGEGGMEIDTGAPMPEGGGFYTVYEPCQNCNDLPHNVPRYLNMTVTNRSNDLIWGALGANYVHFSFLQEYVACCLGLEVGVYNQISNNLHAYKDKWEPHKWLNYYTGPTGKNHQGEDVYEVPHQKDYDSTWTHIPLVNDKETFDREVKEFVTDYAKKWTEPFLLNVAFPMCAAFSWHKTRDYGLALDMMTDVGQEDWRIAGTNWILKRKEMWESKQDALSARED